MTSAIRPTVVAILVGVLVSACWYHRVALSSTDATDAAVERSTEWSFFWKPVHADTTVTCDQGLQGVVVRGNWGFSLLRLVTLGIVGPARVERHCARAVIIDRATPPDTAPPAPPGSVTAWSTGWGVLQYEPPFKCNGRAFTEVRVKANPLYDLISVVSAGGVSPASLGWSCVPGNPPPQATR
jgi:hypothetical protein